MFTTAYSQDGKKVFYYDSADNKYAASGGNLAWRLNNPGLVHSTSRLFSKQAIGHFGKYAIFPTPEKGREALSNWLKTPKYSKGSLKTIAKHYQPDSPADFGQRLSAVTGIPVRTKIRTLSKQEFEQLQFGIEKLCNYTLNGDETFYLMPKILGKIEHGEHESVYLIEGNSVLSIKEALEWVRSYRLDAVIVRERDGNIHLRSRPDHCLQHIHFSMSSPPEPQDIAPLMRIIGNAKPGQCIWAFINGINNTKEKALNAATKISSLAGGERVLSMQNDTKGLWGIIDFGDCVILKASIEIPVIDRAVKFLRYLLALEEKENVPVILFVHSQGGIILEHALKFLKHAEAARLRIFTFGGGSFIAPGKSHSDSHNYASAADFVCRFGSPNLQLLALKRYYAYKEGLTDEQMTQQWAFSDAVLELDSIDNTVVKKFVEDRSKNYKNAFAQISNLTILDPDSDSRWKHRFDSKCYQATVQQLIQKYRK